MNAIAASGATPRHADPHRPAAGEAGAAPGRVRTLSSEGLLQCAACQLVMREPAAGDHAELRCPRCGTPVAPQRRAGLGTTSALLVAALALYLPSNMLPIMATRSGFESRSDTILSGVFELLRSGSWLLAGIVFAASVVIPLLKLGVLGYLVLSVRLRWGHDPVFRTRLYRLIEAVGHWSMLDVFVVGLLAALVQLGPAAEVQAGPGVIAFGAVVWLTLWATRSFDPRLIWDEGADG
jgi:paraquat-inducible protein A